jgi:predicted MFS family arabinose efflux permease
MQTAMTAAQEWRRGWTVVFASVFAFAFFSSMTAAQGVFMAPVQRDLGFDRTTFSSGLSISGIITAVLSPFFGVLIDRYGTRRLALPGLVIISAVIGAFSMATPSATVWVALWVAYGFATLPVKSTVWTTTVAGAFFTARGLALGVTMCGAALAQTITPPLANWLVTEFGWRTAFLWLGPGWGGLAFLVCLPFLRDLHLAPRPGSGEAARQPPQVPGLTVREAIRDRALWQIAISTFFFMALTIGLLVHQFQIMVEAGVSRDTAAWLTSLFGVGGIVGKLLTGFLIDRYAPNWIGGITLASSALAFGLLTEPFHSVPLITLAMAVNGYASGTKLQIVGYLTSRYAGMRNFGKIFGVMAAMIAGGTALGPVLAARIYDTTGDYGLFLVAGVIGSLICGLLVVTLPRYPSFEKRLEPEEAEAVAGQGTIAAN